MKLNFEKQTILTIAIFTGICVAVIGGVILPTMNYIRRLNIETEQLRTYLEKKFENSRHMRTAVSRVEELKAVVSDYPQYLYQTGNELELITTLENIASKNKVQQKIANSNLDQKNIKKIEISINVNGDYKNVLNYLTSIEASKYFLNVEKAQLTTSGASPNDTTATKQANLYLEISLYVNQ